MRLAIFTALVATVAFSPIASAQDPVEPIDIQAISLDYSFAGWDSVTITAGFSFYNYLDVPASYDTEIRLFLGSRLVGILPIHIDAGESICNNDPTCSLVCDINVDGANTSLVHCQYWNTWMQGGVQQCDPGNPGMTCLPLTVCACHAPFTVTLKADYQGELEVTAVGDPQNTMHEADETNNVMTLAPVPTLPVSWSRLKALYH